MLFNSLSYAVFLPLVFGVYWALPHRFRWMVMLAASYFFYMSWNPGYILLILAATGISYAAGLCLEKTASPPARKAIVTAASVFCLGMLFVFKYFNFFVETVSGLFGFLGNGGGRHILSCILYCRWGSRSIPSRPLAM